MKSSLQSNSYYGLIGLGSNTGILDLTQEHDIHVTHGARVSTSFVAPNWKFV